MRMRITRTIVIEGEEDWVRTTLLMSAFPNKDSGTTMPGGNTIRVVDKQTEIKDTPSIWRKVPNVDVTPEEQRDYQGRMRKR